MGGMLSSQAIMSFACTCVRPSELEFPSNMANLVPKNSIDCAIYDLEADGVIFDIMTHSYLFVTGLIQEDP